MALDTCVVTILNWESFNPRKDVKLTSWFRLSNTLLEDPDFYSFSHSELIAWIYILSIASKKYSPTITINFEHAERVGRIKKNELLSAIEKLKQLRIVHADVTSTLRACDVDVTDTNATNKQDRQTEQNNIMQDVPQNGPPAFLPVPKKSKFSEATRKKMRAFIEAYAKDYREKYGGPPEGLRDKALIGKLGYWIETVSEERAIQLIQVYLQIDYRPINESYHDLWQFFRNLNRIGVALETGKDANQIDWEKVFKAGAV